MADKFRVFTRYDGPAVTEWAEAPLGEYVDERTAHEVIRTWLDTDPGFKWSWTLHLSCYFVEDQRETRPPAVTVLALERVVEPVT